MTPRAQLSKSRRIAPFVVLAVACLGVGGYALDRRMRPELVAGPMVQMPAPNAIHVCWRAAPETSTGWVEWRDSTGNTGVIAATRGGGRYDARIEAATPGAQIEYRVLNAGFLGRGIALSQPRLVSSAGPGESFRFIAFGDSGAGSNSQAALAELMVRQKPDVVIHVGDLIYPSGAAEDYLGKFYEPNAELIAFAPFMASLGNHDVATDRGRPLLEEFVLPENGPPGVEPERHYYFDHGDARFVALDSNLTDFDGAMTRDILKETVAPWLRKVLTECDATWRFVYFHHPFYTGSTHPAEGGGHMKDAFVGIFEECGVDVVFCGHNHLYERTAPIRRDAVVPDGEGVVYIVTGAGGKNRYPEAVNPPAYIRAFNDEVFSFTVVDVSPTRVEIRQIDEHGEELDRYVLDKRPEAARKARADGDSDRSS